MRKVSDIPSMRQYRAKQAQPVFMDKPVTFKAKTDWRQLAMDIAWAVAGTVGAFVAVILIMLP